MLEYQNITLRSDRLQILYKNAVLKNLRKNTLESATS